MQRLIELIQASEDWLMARVLAYARERGYTKYTSTLLEAWRLSISGLSASLVEGIARSNGVPELEPDDDCTSDPMAQFGVREAQRHRERGVSFAMFLGLMKYYRQSYVDLVAERASNTEEADRWRRTIDRGFDRIEIAFCQEWARTDTDGLITGMQARNRLMANQKNAYLTAFESLADPVLLLDADHRLVNMNHAAATLLDPAAVPGAHYYGAEEPAGPGDRRDPHERGAPHGPFLGRPATELFPWLAPIVETRRDEGDVCEIETVVAGRSRWFEVKRSAMLDVSGKFTGAILTIRDITGRKMAEQDLRLQSGALQAAANGIVITDAQGTITWVNAAFTRLTGYTAEEAVGRNPRILKSDRHGPTFYRELWETVAAGRVWHGEMINRRKDGTLYTEEMTITPVPDERGRIAHFIAIKQDVTERRRAAEALREESAFRKAIIDMAAEGLCVCHGIPDAPFLTFTVWNDRMTEITGYTQEEINRLGWYQALYADAEARERARTQMARMQAQDRIFDEEWEIIRKDGRRRVIAASTTVLKESDGQRHVVALMQDITDRKRDEEALARHAAELVAVNEELARRNQELDEFAYMASHDLQEPLRKLTAFSELLRRDLGDNLPDRAAKDLGFIVEAARRMQTLIEDVLRLARAGRSDLKMERVSLDDCANRALEALSTRIAETGAEIEREPLPEVYGNAPLLAQLYQNLISNALKFIAPGRRPKVQLTATRDNGDWVLDVQDNGIGIEPQYFEQIFAPFKRLHGRSEYEGSGIGLAICRRAVARHGGRIWVESEPDRGSRFRFTIAEGAACAG